MSGLIGGYFFNQKGIKAITEFRSACAGMAEGNVDNKSSFAEPGLFSLCTVSSNGVHSCGVFENENLHSVGPALQKDIE